MYEPAGGRKNTITHYRITEDNQVGEVRESETNYDQLDITMICLGKTRQTIYNRALRLLDVLLSSEMPAVEKKEILKSEFDIKMAKQMEGDVAEMCNLSQGVEQRGIEKGLARGRQEGRQEGLMQAAQKFLAAGIPAERISEILHIPEKDIKKS